MFAINDKIEQNKMSWKDRVDRIIENSLLQKIINYRSIGNRELGR